MKDRAPFVEHTEHGDFWVFDGGKGRQPVGLTACSGLSYLDFRPAGHRYETIRPGNYDPHERVKDMDIDGIYGTVLYPSVTLTGAKTYGDEPELQKFCVRAYNEWIGEFCEQGAGRLFGNCIIPTTGLTDAVAERGVVASDPPFRNGAAALETHLDARELLAAMLAIERSLGRDRTAAGPRTIDLDLLLFGDVVIDAPGLVVPHPRMHRRRFVLEPLVEIAPGAWHPRLKRTAVELLAGLPAG